MIRETQGDDEADRLVQKRLNHQFFNLKKFHREINSKAQQLEEKRNLRIREQRLLRHVARKTGKLLKPRVMGRKV